MGAADESGEEVQKQGMGMQPGFTKELDKFMRIAVRKSSKSSVSHKR